MAALSPTYAGPETVRRASQPAKASLAGPDGTRAPSVTLPLRFVLTGLVSLLGGMVLVIARPDLLAEYHYNQYVVAATHLFVLGFLCSVVMGATYQLVPVALEARLFSERLARWQFVFHVVGFTGMVWMFWRWDLKQVGHFGSVFAVGVGLFVYNVARTLRRAPAWSVVATGITSALFWLTTGVVAGLVIATGKCAYDSVERLETSNPLWAMLKALEAVALWINQFNPLGVMHAHAHLGVAGFFVMMIMAVSYKLVPMFTLSDVQNPRRARWSLFLFNAGLGGLAVALVLHSPWKIAAALVMATGLGLHLIEMRAILRARRRRVVDWGLRHYVTALGLLAGVAVLGVVLSWPGLPATHLTTQLETVYGWLGILGVVSFTVLGFLYKIVPFLVWYHCYSPAVGRAKVPAMSDLYSERLQIVGYWLFLAGLVGSSLGAALGYPVLVRGGASVLLAGLVVFGLNLGRMLGHFRRPQLAPLRAANRIAVSTGG